MECHQALPPKLERSEMLKPVITTYGWVPPYARGVTRDLRARWACEEEGIP